MTVAQAPPCTQAIDFKLTHKTLGETNSAEAGTHPPGFGGHSGSLWLGFPPSVSRVAHPVSTWDLGWIHENLSISLHTSVEPESVLKF